MRKIRRYCLITIVLLFAGQTYTQAQSSKKELEPLEAKAHLVYAEENGQAVVTKSCADDGLLGHTQWVAEKIGEDQQNSKKVTVAQAALDLTLTPYLEIAESENKHVVRLKYKQQHPAFKGNLPAESVNEIWADTIQIKKRLRNWRVKLNDKQQAFLLAQGFVDLPVMQPFNSLNRLTLKSPVTVRVQYETQTLSSCNTPHTKILGYEVGIKNKKDVGSRTLLIVNAKGEVLGLEKLLNKSTKPKTRTGVDKLIFYIDHHQWPKNADHAMGMPTDDHLLAVNPKWEDSNSGMPGNWNRELRLERWNGNALFPWNSNARIRVRFKISRQTQLGVLVRPRYATEAAQGVGVKNFEARMLKPPVGEWTEVEFDLSQFPGTERLKTSPNELQMHTLVVFGGCESDTADKDLELLVNRILVYLPTKK